ncbi:Low temperature viability protein-domain-containing protein [Rhodofomes roseus]|uniref:Low temperature viability protein-domain-containing protein n=1 Tax=Rhodofomes roseus TaxID=34475 RepID=A0ABQ8KII0_9APHY|nr:Low temperature viability protein-domain-containing protein [Rhodofomes roseus]KAH9837296.1 Low temperature viability protein-domain-containing protein [Rhodofomes roseus]
MPPKSIFRQPGTQHFQLVHRSQRDPLIHDPEASQHVLKAFERGNVAKGKSRAELEKSLAPSELAHDKDRANIGEATLYGVYYDDTDYDYMQHLRPVGMQEAGVDSMLIEAPVKPKGKTKSKDPIKLLDLPPDVLPSTSEISRNYEAQQNIPSSIAGFQPDLDPHLRQTLEALEDDDFVDDDLDDDFFGVLVGEGELAPEEHLKFEFKEEGVENGDVGTKGEPHAEAAEDEEEAGWEARFAKFKKAQKEAPPTDASDIDDYSEGGDTVGTLPQFSVIGGKKRRKGSSDASGYSMSSSSMFRNEGLTMLDERFEEIQKQYDSDEEEEEDGPSDDSDEAPELITTREDFDAMMNEFLDNYEILGGKMRPILAGDTATEKLDTIRKALGKARLRNDDEDNNSEADDILMPLDVDEKQERWDCETILTTYSNLENHPRLIKARQDKPVRKIRLDPKTGLPIVDGKQPHSRTTTDSASESESEDDSRPRVTISRPKNESKEDKQARKQAVKAERQQRRVDKKATKEQFSSEAKRQNRTLANKEKTKARKL